MDCQRIRESMFLVSDDEMEDELVIIFREHLSLCPPCHRRYQYVTRLLSLVRNGCQREVAPAGLEVKIRERLLLIRSQGSTDGGRA